MKTIILIMLAVTLLGVNALLASPLKPDASLKSPSILSNIVNPPSELGELKKLIDKGDWEAFYYAAVELYKNSGRTDDASMNKEQLVNKLWIFYYLAVAPVGHQNLSNFNEETPDFVDYRKDIDLKFRAFNSLVYLYYPYASQELKERKRDLDVLVSSYCAAYIRQMRAVVNNGFSDKLPTETDVFGEQYVRGQFDARQSYLRMYGTARKRHQEAESNVEYMENRFVPGLVENFAGKKADVLKYLRMAGYEDKEIDALIDRTVGREPKTEFLYKGRSKKGVR